VIPEPNPTLARLAYNLRWAWHTPTANLFRSLAPEVWDNTTNPLAVVKAINQTPAVLAARADLLAGLGAALDEYLSPQSLTQPTPRVAYFSAEFAIAECLPLYSGGLGVLAGDHLKAASDLGVPMIGIGLLYRYGYFRQTIDAAGRQREVYDRLDTESVPLLPVMAADGVPLEIGVPFPGRTVVARAWLARVGRVPLYLLDTDVPRNREDDRWITGHLYGGDSDTRLRQEIVLGIGGARLIEALRRLGLEVAPEVYHLNEGHSAFVAIERAAQRMRSDADGDFFGAYAQVAQTTAFTTHTPVAAGNDTFSAELIEAYLSDYREQLGLTSDEFMSLGRRDPNGRTENFSMTVLALRSAQVRNAVSKQHGMVSRQLWGDIGVGVGNTPPRIGMDSITNGVHTATWTGPQMSRLLDRYLGPWRKYPHRASTWSRILVADARELWGARKAQRERLLQYVESATHAAGEPDRHLVEQDPLVIGFARRFATYKRAGLLLREPHRLDSLLTNLSRPVLLVFAGKAHPHDEPGKLLIQRIVEASREGMFGGQIVFLPDYSIELGRVLVQGSDLWLNTPRRPIEASGTSGMKATLNGALNVSELDGWWDEAYVPGLGWALGNGIPDEVSGEARDQAEASQLMDLLESDIVPLFFTRDVDGIPSEWLTRIQRSMAVFAATFSAHRMVNEYADRVYRPLARSCGAALPSIDMSLIERSAA
jgi:glycogen phosphorylase